MPFDAAPWKPIIDNDSQALDLLKRTRDHLYYHPEQWCEGRLAVDESFREVAVLGAAKRCAWGTMLWLDGFVGKDDIAMPEHNARLRRVNEMFPDLVNVNDREGREAVIERIDSILTRHKG